MTALALDDRDQMLLAGGGTAAEQLAMRIIVRVGEAMGAERLIDITRAHIDSCLYHGRAGLDFAVRLRKGGARVVVPTTLNVSSLDLLHPDLYRGDPETARLAREQMDQYEAMGCRTTWTCAPYQLPDRPAFGEHVAWAESNAIVFANSVLGARTHRYGDFIDICAALTGRVPDGGLHRTENRRGRIVFDLERLPASVLARDDLAALVGHVMGDVAGTAVPVIVGAPTGWTEDDLKALGAAGASSGAVAMFHAVGVTPEAATLEAALQGGRPDMTVVVTTDMLADARKVLSTGVDGPVSSVNLGTPHASLAEIRSIVARLRRPACEAGSGVLRIDRPRRGVGGRGTRSGGGPRRVRRPHRRGHLHLHHADHS